jgi:viroplasmin and RNaseH domain-containing protein
MAQTPPTTYTPPSASTLTELYYAQDNNGVPATTLTQIFGVQAIPPADTAKEDITYRTLESDTEFAVKGVKPYESIEVECIYYKEQYTALKTLADSNKELWWYVKLPESQQTVYNWRGSIDVSMAEIALDDMLRCVIKIGKSTKPTVSDSLPSGA